MIKKKRKCNYNRYKYDTYYIPIIYCCRVQTVFSTFQHSAYILNNTIYYYRYYLQCIQFYFQIKYI